MPDDLFDWAAAEGAALRDAGMELAGAAQDAADAGWGERAYRAIVAVARSQSTVHVDDVLRVFTEEPEHPNAWGSIWRRAIGDGVIVRTGTVRESVEPRKHRHCYPIYASLIEGGPRR